MVVLAFLLAGILQYLSFSQIQAYESRKQASSLVVVAMHNYFSITKLLPLGSNEYAVIANAFNIARLGSSQDLDQFSNGGAALKHLIPIVNKTKPGPDKWRALAAYEALVILTAMPWDAEIARAASKAAEVLTTELQLTVTSSTSEERQLANRIISIYKSRLSPESETRDAIPISATEKDDWIIGFTEVRSSLARCMNANGTPTDAAIGAVKTGFGFKWLSEEAYDGWDAARVEAVKLVSSNSKCRKYAEQVGKLIDLTSKE